MATTLTTDFDNKMHELAFGNYLLISMLSIIHVVRYLLVVKLASCIDTTIFHYHLPTYPVPKLAALSAETL